MINPHGGRLINRILSYEKTKHIHNNAAKYTKLYLTDERAKDVKNIAVGVYSPLTGFLTEKDFVSVAENMRLANGTVWPIPIVLDITAAQKKKISGKKELLLCAKDTKEPVALLTNTEIYAYDKTFFVKNVFGTTNKKHPGVEEVLKMKRYLLGGDIQMLETKEALFPEHNMTPAQTRNVFLNRGWNTVGAFQTRNIPHKGHEYLQRQTLQKTDGLFIQPVIGKKKLEDFKDEYIIGSYELLIDNYLPQGKVVLGILPLEMRYAGPREAVFHAIIRQNYGCTHFIVGRDHAGVGNFYEPFAAQDIFDTFKKGEIDIEILKYPEVVYDKENKRHCFIDDCDEQHRVKFSGTALRTLIKNKDIPPEYLITPEVYKLITNSNNALVDEVYKKDINHDGFVLWFTGLSQSGKSTIADRVHNLLTESGHKVERLDGDIVRESLTKDLGFSKEDRDENIRRVGFVAKLLSRNGVAVIASFISPYKAQRDNLRLKIPNFIEVFVNTPLEVCEQWDKKGYYQKARNGEIKNFTGISAPYEIPEIPEIELRPDLDGIDKSAQKVVRYLKKRNFII